MFLVCLSVVIWISMKIIWENDINVFEIRVFEKGY